MASLYVLLGVFFVPVMIYILSYVLYHKYKDITEARRIHEEFRRMKDNCWEIVEEDTTPHLYACTI